MDQSYLAGNHRFCCTVQPSTYTQCFAAYLYTVLGRVFSEVHYSQQWCVELATFMVGKNPALYIAKTEGGRGRSIRFIEDGQPGELATTPTKTDFPLIIVPAKARGPNLQHYGKFFRGRKFI